MSVGAIGAEILGGGGIHPPPWYTSLKHPMVLGVKYPLACNQRECRYTYTTYMYYIELKCTANLPGEMYTITGELANRISFKVLIYTNFLIY